MADGRSALRMKLEVTGHRGNATYNHKVIIQPGAMVTVERGQDTCWRGCGTPGDAE